MKKDSLLIDNYINRELSWIDFNQRVLELAADNETPLLEKAKFNAIFSNNLDEFFMVRVASLKAQVEANITKESEDGRSPKQQLEEIRKKLKPLLEEQQYLSNKLLRKEFKKDNIYILDYTDLDSKQKEWADKYFNEKIFPILTPLAVDPAHPFPFVSNLSLNLAAVIVDNDNQRKQFARIKIPQNNLNRFISLPIDNLEKNEKTCFVGVPIETIVSNNLNRLFPGMTIEDFSFFRVTRDADLELRDIEADDLMSALEEGLRKRRLGGEVVRLEVSQNISNQMLDLLVEGMNVKNEDLYKINGLLGLDQLINLMSIEMPKLKYKSHQGITLTKLKNSQLNLLEDGSIKQEEFKNIFSIINDNDVLLHHPFELFSTSVEEFINQAANDINVMGIKMTLYRISKDSQIIDALIKAAENGKEVMALVELKARFDEDNNIQWAKQLEQRGVHVVYGVIGLKTHTKIALVIRKEKNQLKSYFHIGTGNYNNKTSTSYTDIGLLSKQKEIGEDLIELFNYLSGFSKQRKYQKLLVAPVSLRTKMEDMIKREIQHAKDGKKGLIIAKMNSLVDPQIIKLLYQASQAGVKIELIVRGMCCLYPGRKNLSENIIVKSVIGRFLEHSRIFLFGNNNNSEIFIGSADWMKRNLDRRIEAITPIEDPKIKKQLEKLLSLYMRNNFKCWLMDRNGNFQRIKENGKRVQFIHDELIELSGS